MAPMTLQYFPTTVYESTMSEIVKKNLIPMLPLAPEHLPKYLVGQEQQII
jgi:hypothetical protein